MNSDMSAICDITIEDVEYLRHGDEPLLARLYLPKTEGPVPLVAEVHGGAWCRGDRLDEDALNQGLARRGVAVAALDFRMPPAASYPASLADINYGVRWLKANSAKWGSRPELVSMLGVSSGAHQIMLAAMRPEDPRYASLALPEGSAEHDARVARAIMCWPVIDPLGRYEYALALQAGGGSYPAGIDRVIPDHMRFWGDKEAMAEGNPVRILENDEKVERPALLCIQGDQDRMHPREHLERFIALYEKAGGTVTMSWYENEAEGFVKTKPDSPATARAADEIAQFLKAGL
ncbi:alpha/beta hydrolase [Alcaligenaceae bacterium]|nr:alpha/beta hydrolase [Alcaligenaceae bacterium]